MTDKTTDKKKKILVPVCEENKYISKKQIKENTGLSKNAKILME
jgi:hypothetical protein